MMKNKRYHILIPCILILLYIASTLSDIKKASKENASSIKRINDNILYLTENVIGIKNLKQENQVLKHRQLIMIETLHVLDEIFKANKIEYWLDWGSALGARRHEDFIPWDDDIDIGMTRENYEKTLTLMKTIKLPYGIKFREPRYREHDFSGFYIETVSGIQIDLFAYNYVNMEKYNEFIKYGSKLAKLKIKRSDKMHEGIQKVYLPQKIAEFITDKMLDMFWKKYRVNNSDYIVQGTDYPFKYANGEKFIPIAKKDIFPLKRMKFGKYSFYAPKNIDKYLEMQFGQNYMSLPSSLQPIHSCAFSYTELEKLKAALSVFNKNDIKNTP